MKQNSFIKWGLVFAIVLIANMLFNYSLSVFYEEPVFDQMCPDESLIVENQNSTSCKKIGGAWVVQFVEDLDAEIGYCNIYKKCNIDFESRRTDYEQTVFYTLVGAGAVILILALFVKIPTISIAFALTAFVDFAFASIRYWEYSNEIMRVSILFVTLLVLIFIAITRYTRKKENEGI